MRYYENEKRPGTIEPWISNTELGWPTNSVGIGVLLINAKTGHILIGQEPDDKTINGETTVIRGQFSIPTESRKKGPTLLNEMPHKNAQAALVEEVLRRTPQDVRNHLIFLTQIPKVPTVFREIVQVNGDPNKKGDLAIVMYDPKDTDPLKSPQGDLENLQWVPFHDALTLYPLRKVTRDFLTFLDKSGFDVRSYVDAYRELPQNHTVVFRYEFDKEEFIKERNLAVDLYR